MSLQHSGTHLKRADVQLPVIVSDEVARANPELCVLLGKLATRMRPDGSSNDVAARLTRAQEELGDVKRRLLGTDALHRTLQAALLDAHTAPHNVQNPQALEAAQARVSAQEAQQRLQYPLLSAQDNPAVGECHYFGLSVSDLMPEPATQADVSAVVAEVEERLMTKSRALEHMLEPQKPEEDGLDVAAVLELRVARLDRLTLELKKRRLDMHCHKKALIQVWLECLGLLRAMCEEHLLKAQFAADSVSARWLIAKTEALCSKLLKVKYQIMNETYTASHVEALTSVRDALEVRGRQLAKERESAALALQSYRGVGFGFDEIVAEYGRLLEQIEERAWQVQALRGTALPLVSPPHSVE